LTLVGFPFLFESVLNLLYLSIDDNIVLEGRVGALLQSPEDGAGFVRAVMSKKLMMSAPIRVWSSTRSTNPTRTFRKEEYHR
jgi:hypothetical protein